MNDWVPIQYRDFWDVPRIFLAEHHGMTLLFDCPFDELAEDYPTSYRVYEMPKLSVEELTGSWHRLHTKATRFLGEVPLSGVNFDPTRRAAVDGHTLDRIASRQGSAERRVG